MDTEKNVKEIVNRIQEIEFVLSHKTLTFSRLSSKIVLSLLEKYEFQYVITVKGDLFELYLNPYAVDTFYQLYELELFGGK